MNKTGEANVAKVILDLSNRQKEILQLSARGISNEKIAGIYGIKIATVKTYFGNIRRKLGDFQES